VAQTPLEISNSAVHTADAWLRVTDWRLTWRMPSAMARATALSSHLVRVSTKLQMPGQPAFPSSTLACEGGSRLM